MDTPTERALERAIAGALRSAIRDHGPITTAWIGSATKRVLGNLANARLTAADAIAVLAVGRRRARNGLPLEPGVAHAGRPGENGTPCRSPWPGGRCL